MTSLVCLKHTRRSHNADGTYPSLTHIVQVTASQILSVSEMHLL